MADPSSPVNLFAMLNESPSEDSVDIHTRKKKIIFATNKQEFFKDAFLTIVTSA